VWLLTGQLLPWMGCRPVLSGNVLERTSGSAQGVIEVIGH
jgi:hypothetical protein